jgi:arylsulfatase A-like enzyme
MSRFVALVTLALILFPAGRLAAQASSSGRPPNIVFILADDLGYGDLGSYGQQTIATPHLDQLAAQGVRFTQFYAGSTVCAPSRSVLMTGRHLGHTTVRGNAGAKGPQAQTLAPTDVTFATMLKQAGYATGLIGKWGLGERESSGAPWRQGFDYFYGFLNQSHAHNHFPDHLWRYDARSPLSDNRVALKNDLVPMGNAPGVGYATKRVEYANDLFFDEAEAFVERHRGQPFLLFLSLTVPHANNERSRALGDGQEVPDYGAYSDAPWKDATKGQAAMITRMDAGVGKVMDRLRALGLDDNTVVMFSSDNGPHREGGPDYAPEFFKASGPLRGIKRDLTEGGIRVPFIVRWPAGIKTVQVSDHVGYFGDLLVTFAELAGAPAPGPHDGLSLVPTLRGQAGRQAKHPYLYWEFYERTFRQAVVLEGRWKGIRAVMDDSTFELYDLENDLGETKNVASQHPDLTARIADLMAEAHVPNAQWSFQPATAAPAP